MDNLIRVSSEFQHQKDTWMIFIQKNPESTVCSLQLMQNLLCWMSLILDVLEVFCIQAKVRNRDLKHQDVHFNSEPLDISLAMKTWNTNLTWQGHHINFQTITVFDSTKAINSTLTYWLKITSKLLLVYYM